MALYNMAWAYYSKKDYQTALVKYQAALKVEPLTRLRPLIEKNIGLIYYDQSYFTEAIIHLKKSVEMDPSLIEAYYILGQSYLKNKDSKNARQSFQNVVQLSPESSFGLKAKNYLQSLQ
jgi:tetratricopeptide (TPR) repeat protein